MTIFLNDALPSLCRFGGIESKKEHKLFMIILHGPGSAGKRRCWKMRLWINKMQISKAQYTIKEDMSGVYYEQQCNRIQRYCIKAKLDRDNILVDGPQLD